MQKILKWRWLILAIWLVSASLLTVFQPDVNAILHERGQDPLTKDSPSKVASELLKEMTGDQGTSDIIVFHNENKLSDTDLTQIETGIENIRDQSAELGVHDMIDPFSTPEAKSSLLSENGTTLMVSFSLDKGDREVAVIKEQLEQELADVDTDFYLSGEDFIQNDYLEATTAGVEKSALLTVVFILAVLIIMFRSLLIPFISLLTVGITYLVSMGIAAQIIEKLNFPVTSVTQMLLVLILFGIGTDYNILLFNRFKEELAHGATIDEAIFTTFRTAGKTILYSTLTVFIAFAALSFSNFGIYKSANVVAIGAIVLIVQIYTLTPFFMKTLGEKLFWPAKQNNGHKDSKFWTKLATISVKYPVITTALIIIIMIPVLMFSKQTLSFDQLKELGNGYPSTKGFSLVAENFSEGQALPTNVVIQNDEPMDNNDALAVIDSITLALNELEGVDSVSSVTQPQFEEIPDLYTDSQTSAITDGISASRDGVDQIQDGLSQMEAGLETPDFSEVDQLVSGSGEITSGYQQLTDAVKELGGGISDSASGATGLSSGIAEIRSGLSSIQKSSSQVSSGLREIQKQYTALGSGYESLAKQLPGIQQGMTGINGLITALGTSHSELASDDTYVQLKTQGAALEGGIAQWAGGLTQLNTNYEKLNSAFTQATGGLDQINSAQGQILSGLKELENGAKQLSSGLNQGASGADEIAANMNKLNDALAKVNQGQEELSNGLSQFSGGLTSLKDGLHQSGNGLEDISEGLGKTNEFLTQFESSKTFFIPREALEGEDFAQVLDNFMSEDRKITKLMVILNDDPYSMKAMDTIEEINDTVASGLKGTVLDGAVFGAAGPSSTTYDTNKVQLESFNGTAVIVIIGVFLVLLFVIRSILPSIYIVISLIVSYFVAMAATNLVTYQILGADGVSSFVPFFSFIIIVAVGVDYSIFFMMRYKEYGELDPAKALVESAKNIGGVIISAMIILGGTFATLIPSGLVLLIELASAVIAGLLVLCFILLPMLVPALIMLPNAFSKRKNTAANEKSTLHQ
ncbi:membrane protein [Paenibacillus sp. J45TS6]|uniref:MMPL family transporter n=1 Tax=Paenibacillus sp. J45TS6 TaxID=2807196 RepID=UPI001B19D034|nr:MMPL family transporter [Paenibacillus sp. J45TS6]GIP46198.1 membrane protein [Paenibacillus sp. J45TS6]